MRHIRFYSFILLLFCISSSYAKVSLPAYFSDNMIIQQKSSLVFPGKAKPNKNIVLETGWDKKKYTTRSDSNGTWSIEIKTPQAGGPYRISVSDGEVLSLTNVMVGEIWFCSGQSNMEMPVGGWGKVMNYEQEIANADYPSIRLLQVKKTTALSPSHEINLNMGGWQECAPSTVAEFSSIAYFYARKLWNELNVPIGVIDCTWGGTPAEAWTSFSTLQHVSGYQEAAKKMEQAGFNKEAVLDEYQRQMDARNKTLIAKDKGYDNGLPIWISSFKKGNGWKLMDLPGNWEQKELDDFDGIVWFQKEIDIPAGWEGKPIELNLGMIDDEDITYYNGVEIARGAGFMTPRKYTVPANLVKQGKGLITVRVADHAGEGGITGETKDLFAQVGNDKISLAGLWNYQIGVSALDLPPMPVSPESSSCPTVLYNGMVHPLIKFPIKGVIWYQGEANVDNANKYAALFQSLITDWRSKWKQELPFYFVQLANYLERKEVQPESQWAALREAQAQVLHLRNTGMAVAIDLGEANDIHPKNKQDVALRLASLALSHTYQKNEVIKTPHMTDYYISGNVLTIEFSDTPSSKSASIKGFTLCGADNVFYPATARIEGNKLLLESENVKNPIAARYGWADNPECSLIGRSGYPIAPFRTDK